ncbi:hypothetical protein, variant [Verruconis gallopava]|uniref:HTH APSES-type domain-containing protein n=1 Tax=Verruconis gallopava TaxID=253628 RepID=A0A0D1YH83_9PEZI|nr:uncharacterized protein PV09_08228 [Verruconis gallopava]XP_016210057.1 hypothetical protein, variant [Verruconis gallopava]KIW00187.1 hypothetical protein PV09_08228 [Verruconis gallopava]KIW00188.1 hypothetical protein, variant [Verruconis gallopava]
MAANNVNSANSKIYGACYSNVPVYEYNVGPGVHIMRRRADDWINATHILKAAAYDKPTRTRILEREVQKGVHEKVQGGYGKYQGTWIPLADGRALAERNGVLDKLLPIFDYVPGDRSPPPAPKHATAASNRPKQPRIINPPRRMPVNSHASLHAHAHSHSQSMSQYDQDELASVGQYHEGTPDNMTIASESMMDVDDPYAQHYPGSRKRKRDQMSFQDQQHQIWADQLLDYFMLLESEDSFPSAPEPPPGINLDRPIDEKGHSAMHWAAAMGDIDVVKDLLRRNARIDCLNNNLETPLMRAVMFTNNFDKQTMPALARILAPTVQRTDWFGSTVFHHIAATTSSKNKYKSARYYIDTLVNVLAETWIPDEITKLLNMTDQNGDTCVMIAARNGARKCVRSLLGRNVAVDRPNNAGETADELIRELNARRRAHLGKAGLGAMGVGGRELSSSPFAPDGRGMNGDGSAMVNFGGGSNSLAMQREPTFRSATANSVATRLLPNITERLTGLAKAFETEYETKMEEQVEIERVLRKRTGELEYLRKQLEDLAPVEEELSSLSQADEVDVEAELASLEREAEAYLELEHMSSLRELVAMGPPPPSSSNGVLEPSPEKLKAMQDQRRRMVRTLVDAMGNAGMGERVEGYKRLIRGAIGVRESEIEGMLDEVLRELEEEARERDGGYRQQGTATITAT